MLLQQVEREWLVEGMMEIALLLPPHQLAPAISAIATPVVQKLQQLQNHTVYR